MLLVHDYYPMTDLELCAGISQSIRHSIECNYITRTIKNKHMKDNESPCYHFTRTNNINKTKHSIGIPSRAEGKRSLEWKE